MGQELPKCSEFGVEYIGRYGIGTTVSFEQHRRFFGENATCSAKFQIQTT
jgi:hypothetical protein